MKFVVFTLCCGVLLHIVSGQTCPFPVYLDASDSVQEFESHALYGFTSYYSDMYACWVIEAPLGENVHLKTDIMDLEPGCTENWLDRVLIYDGEDGYADIDKHLCSSDDLYDYHTTGRYAYVEFITDGSDERGGFRMLYWSEDENTDDEDHDDEEVDVGAIIGIIFGVLLGLAIIIAFIVACVICCGTAANKGKVHSTTPGQGTNYRYQTYPSQQYATNGNQAGAVVMASGQASYPTTKVAPGPGVQAAQSHPVDANGVPMPAVYIEP